MRQRAATWLAVGIGIIILLMAALFALFQQGM